MEYIERDAAIEAIDEALKRVFVLPVGKSIIDKIPAADVRPVVRCKECRHRDPEDHKCDCGGMERQGCPFKVADDYFCAYGER